MNRKGFTLVELAIVLVIIGLLVGGVLQGQELIKQAQIRSVVSKFSEFDTALNTFRAKYRETPGDMTKASTFGVDRPKGGSVNLADTGLTGDNGDGDGNLESAAGGTAAAFDGEIANFWVMLSNATLVKGTYTQTANCAAGTCSGVAGTGLPDAPIGTGIGALTSGGRIEYVVGVSSPLGSTTAAFNAASGTAGSVAGHNLTPEEAFGIDSKVDDGKPDNGIVRFFNQYSAAGAFSVGTLSATTCYAAANGDYALTLETKICSLRIRASG